MKLKRVNKLSPGASVWFEESKLRREAQVENKVGGVYQIRFPDKSTRLVSRESLVRRG